MEVLPYSFHALRYISPIKPNICARLPAAHRSLPLMAGRYSFKFVLDGSVWICHPTLPLVRRPSDHTFQDGSHLDALRPLCDLGYISFVRRNALPLLPWNKRRA